LRPALLHSCALATFYMSKAYYYFVASLPTISFQAQPLLTLENFLLLGKEHLSPADYQKINDALFADPSQAKMTSGPYGAWIAYNRRFRNEVAFYRAKRANKNPEQYLRGEYIPDQLIAIALEHATKAADPLSADKILDQTRSQFLDELIKFHYFDFEVVFIYALKLQMIERYQRIESGLGKEVLEEYKKIPINLS